MNKLYAYTDGACSGNPGPGGWGALLQAKDGADVVKERSLQGGEADTTNNRMELTAVIRGFEAALAHAATEKPVIELVADSKYVLQGIEEWMAGWKARGWMKAGKPPKPVLNVLLWKELDSLVSRLDLTCTWVRGHTGHVENERCDALVKDGIRSIGGVVE